MATLRIGCSGYQYDHWRGSFYPPELPKRGWFGFYARHFDTVEVNNTFYRLPRAQVFDAWRDQAPERFLFTLKFSQYGTHRKRLLEPENSVVRFVDGAQRLGGHRGPILVQLPPRWRRNPERLEAFLAATPHAWRWALELRDPSWFHESVYAVLRRHGAALCLHDMLPDHPRELTADWVYLRFHGGAGHEGDYSRAQLRAHAAQLREWLAAGLDIYAYFNNDLHGHAVRNALALRDLVQETAPRTGRARHAEPHRPGDAAG